MTLYALNSPEECGYGYMCLFYQQETRVWSSHQINYRYMATIAMRMLKLPNHDVEHYIQWVKRLRKYVTNNSHLSGPYILRSKKGLRHSMQAAFYALSDEERIHLLANSKALL